MKSKLFKEVSGNVVDETIYYELSSLGRAINSAEFNVDKSATILHNRMESLDRLEAKKAELIKYFTDKGYDVDK
jgi:hypothetical protein